MSSAGHGHEHHKSALELARENRATLNDIPVPAGSWQEHYDKRNAKWNMMLGASIVVFAGTLYAVCLLFLFVTVEYSKVGGAVYTHIYICRYTHMICVYICIN